MEYFFLEFDMEYWILFHLTHFRGWKNLYVVLLDPWYKSGCEIWEHFIMRCMGRHEDFIHSENFSWEI